MSGNPLNTGLSLFQKLLSEKKRLSSQKIILDKKDTHIYPIKEIPFNIPSNWHWAYLSDVSIIQEGPGIRKHQYAKGGVQFLTVTNILEGTVDIDNVKKYISLSEYNNTYKHFTINKGDIVTACSGGSWGKSAIFDKDEKLILNTSTLRLRFFNDLGDNKYLYYLTKMQYFKDNLSKYTTGQQPNYGYYHYSRIPIPIPPFSEQKRIVAILDEAFAAIDKAKANAEKNLQNAKELFESYLQNVFAKKGADWEEKTLDEIIESNVIGLTKSIREQRFDYKFKYVKMNNITRDNRFDLSKYTCVNATKEEAEKYSLSKGDFLFNTRNSYELVGKTCLFKGYEDEVILYNNNIMRIRFIKSVNSHFINYSFTTKNVIKKLDALKSGTTNVSAIYYKDLKNLLLLIPTLKEQQAIINKLDTLSTETKKLETLYDQKVKSLEELKKSILQKAFSGELTAIKEMA